MKDSLSEGQKNRLSPAGGRAQVEKEGKTVSGGGNSPCTGSEAECVWPSQGPEDAGGA